MNSPFAILPIMIMAHIVDDFYLQGILAKLKQRSFWKDHPNELYKYDYVVALFIHGLSWSFMILLPIALLQYHNYAVLCLIWILNALIHSFIDDLKANKLKINLITDQILHFIQIAATFIIAHYFL
jgi:hypothetical protein